MNSDVLVIGGGPAGLAAAIALRQRGLPVEVADPCLGSDAEEPIDKCCGEGLLPAAVQALGLLGLPAGLLLQHGFPFEGIRFHSGKLCASARFRSSSLPALGLRRTALHRLLLRRAREAGVRLTSHTARLLGEREDGCRVLVGGSLRDVRWVVGADGMQSSVRGAAGLGQSSGTSQRFAIRQHFRLARDSRVSPFVEVYWAGATQAYVTPVDRETVGVAVIARDRTAGMDEAMQCFPALLDRLHGAAPASRERGAVTLHRTLQAVHGASVALVGDASGSVDAITGDGLALAFTQSLALADSLARGGLAGYGQAHRRMGRTARCMSRVLLTMGAVRPLTGSSLWLLAHTPRLFPALLRLHTAGA